MLKHNPRSLVDLATDAIILKHEIIAPGYKQVFMDTGNYNRITSSQCFKYWLNNQISLSQKYDPNMELLPQTSILYRSYIKIKGGLQNIDKANCSHLEGVWKRLIFISAWDIYKKLFKIKLQQYFHKKMNLQSKQMSSIKKSRVSPSNEKVRSLIYSVRDKIRNSNTREEELYNEYLLILKIVERDEEEKNKYNILAQYKRNN